MLFASLGMKVGNIVRGEVMEDVHRGIPKEKRIYFEMTIYIIGFHKRTIHFL